MRDVPCPVCEGTTAQAGDPGRDDGGGRVRREVHRPGRRAVHRRVLGVPQRAHPRHPRDRRSPARCSRRCSPGSASCSTSGWTTCRLSRAAGTLSGGEAQRIRLATQIGSGLVGVLYVLDEPSIGLHQRDNRRLIETLVRLRDLGNTLIVVEHDLDTIAHADWVVDIGPAAGEHGGQIVHSGTYDDLLTQSRIRSPALTFPARRASRSPRSGGRSTASGS